MAKTISCIWDEDLLLNSMGLYGNVSFWWLSVQNIKLPIVNSLTSYLTNNLSRYLVNLPNTINLAVFLASFTWGELNFGPVMKRKTFYQGLYSLLSSCEVQGKAIFFLSNVCRRKLSIKYELQLEKKGWTKWMTTSFKQCTRCLTNMSTTSLKTVWSLNQQYFYWFLWTNSSLKLCSRSPPYQSVWISISLLQFFATKWKVNEWGLESLASVVIESSTNWFTETGHIQS